jgi:hypothetical protein
MKKRNILISSILSVALATSLYANEATQSKEIKSVQNKVNNSTHLSLKSKKHDIVKEAINTINNTNLVLDALDKKDTKKALDLLANISGKLDVIIAQDPNLELLPVSISSVEHDLIIDKDTVFKIKKEAIKAIRDDRLQDARKLIKDLASEVVITTTSIPLVTYPSDIKAIVPLISNGKLEDAKLALHALLNSLVITKEVIALPVLRAKFLLENAEVLAENKKRDNKKDEELKVLIDVSKYQLELAQSLGYGTKDDFKPIYEQLEIIQDKIKNKNNGVGWFDKIKEKIKNLNN